MRTRFEFALPLVKAYKDEAGRMHVVGVASDTLPDLQQDRMSDKAIAAMAKQATKDALPLLDNHRATFGFGRSVEGRSVLRGKARQLHVDFELDGKYPQAVDLFAEVQSGRAQKQLSIGGTLNLDNPKAVRFEEDRKTGRVVRVIEDITLDHVATTRPKQAANARTGFIQAVVKDLFGEKREEEAMNDAKAPGEGAKSEESAGNQGEETPDTHAEGGDTPASESSPAPATHTSEDTQAEEDVQTGEDEESGEGSAEANPAANDAEKGLSFLARLGRMLRGQGAPNDSRDKPALVEQQSPEAVKAMAAAFETLRRGPLTEKARFDLRRMATLIRRFLDEQGEAPNAPADAPDGRSEPGSPKTDANKMLAAGVARETQRLEKALRSHTEDALVKGLGALSEHLSGELGVVRQSLEKNLGGLDRRVARLEQVAGVRTSPEGQETPASVRKDQNPFRGIFGGALEQARRATKGGTRQ